ncbi:MAG: hypothetical protein ACRDI3_03765 [Actinomycetota bacterium]
MRRVITTLAAAAALVGGMVMAAPPASAGTAICTGGYIASLDDGRLLDPTLHTGYVSCTATSIDNCAHEWEVGIDFVVCAVI